MENGVFVEATIGPVSLIAVAPAGEVSVYARKPMLMAGFFLPAGDTPLRIVDASAERMTLAPARLPFGLSRVAGPVLHEGACGDVGLVTRSLSIRPTLGISRSRAALTYDEVPLSTSVGAPPVALLKLGPSHVEILEHRESAIRVSRPIPEGILTGWVPSSALRPGAWPADQAGAAPTPGLAFSRPHSTSTATCPTNLSLGVREAGGTTLVGSVRAGSVVARLAGGPPLDVGDWTPISVPDAAVDLLNSATFVVPSLDLQRCMKQVSPN